MEGECTRAWRGTAATTDEQHRVSSLFDLLVSATFIFLSSCLAIFGILAFLFLFFSSFFFSFFFRHGTSPRDA